MGIVRCREDRADVVLFAFRKPREGRRALRKALAMGAGRCGKFQFVPPDNAKGFRYAGYVGFFMEGDTNMLAALAFPWLRRLLKKSLRLTDKRLNAIVSPHMRANGWCRKEA